MARWRSSAGSWGISRVLELMELKIPEADGVGRPANVVDQLQFVAFLVRRKKDILDVKYIVDVHTVFVIDMRPCALESGVAVKRSLLCCPDRLAFTRGGHEHLI